MTVEHEQWGPNGIAVEQVVRRARRLTDDEVRRLASAWHAWTAPDPADGPLDFGDSDPWQVASDGWNEAVEALDEVVAAAGRTQQVEAAGKAAADVVWDAAWDFVMGAGHANSAAFAAELAAELEAAADLVGTGGLTIAHADMLLGPWRAVCGGKDVEPVCECGP